MSANSNAGFMPMAAAIAMLLASSAATSDDASAIEIVERYYSKFQTPDFFVDDLMKFYADDVLFTDPTFEIVANGKDEVRKLYADLGTDQTNYSNIKWQLKNVVNQDDMIVIRGNWSGRFYHCDFDVEFVTLWKLRNGLLAEQTDFFAASTFDNQVGWDADKGIADCPE